MNIVYVDRDDKVIGSGSKVNAMSKGIIVRVSRVFLVNKQGELLIQKRSADSSLLNRWDQSAAGHVDEGEDYKQAAARELNEEMGISGVKLAEAYRYYTEEADETLVKKRQNALFIGKYDGPVKPDPEEVSGYRWVKPAVLSKEMAEYPNDFTEGFIRSFEVYQSLKT